MADTEKITINLSVVDLGKIELLIDQGFYSSRTDFIRTAIRNQISTHANSLEQTVERRQIGVGILVYDKSDLEKHIRAEEMMNIRLVGMVVLSKDITPELALAAINSIKVYGVLQAKPELKLALKDRIL